MTKGKGETGMKIGISSYSYNSLVTDGSMSLPDVIDSVAEAGFDQIELVGITPPAGTDVIRYAETLRSRAIGKGIEISAYTVGADFLHPENGGPEDEVDRIKRCLDVAAALGAPKLRHDAAWGFSERQGNYREALDIISPHLLAVTEYAQSLGIKTMCENHGYFMQDSYRMERLVRKVNHPNFGLLVDIGNFLCADESPVSAVGRVAPYAFHVHAKDFLFKSGAEISPGDGWFPTRCGNHLRGTVLGHGIVPVSQCLQTLRTSGYDGDVSVEFEGLESPRFAAKAGLALLRRLLKDC